MATTGHKSPKSKDSKHQKETTIVTDPPSSKSPSVLKEKAKRHKKDGKSTEAILEQPATISESSAEHLAQLLSFSEQLEKELGIDVASSTDQNGLGDTTAKSPKRKKSAEADDQHAKKTALHTTPYITSAQLSKLPADVQQSFIDQTSAVSLHTVSLLKKCLTLQHSLNFPTRPPPTSTLSLKDIEVNSKLPLNEQYIQLTLWNQILRMNLKSNKNLDTFLYKQKKQEKEEEEKNTAASSSAAASEENRKTFRDYYMQKLTQIFGDEIDQLREEKSFDEKKLSSLVDCLESGVNLFQESDRMLHLTALKKSNQNKKRSAVHLSEKENASAVKQTEQENSSE